MKNTILAAALLVAGLTQAADSKWTEVPTSKAGAQAFINTKSLVVSDEGYKGLQAFIVLPSGFDLKDGTHITSEIIIVEVKCSTGESRGKRMVYLDAQGHSYAAEGEWIGVTGAPATELAVAVKAQVCG